MQLDPLNYIPTEPLAGWEYAEPPFRYSNRRWEGYEIPMAGAYALPVGGVIQLRILIRVHESPDVLSGYVNDFVIPTEMKSNTIIRTDFMGDESWELIRLPDSREAVSVIWRRGSISGAVEGYSSLGETGPDAQNIARDRAYEWVDAVDRLILKVKEKPVLPWVVGGVGLIAFLALIARGKK